MTFQLTAGRFRAETDAGLPLVGGMLYTYASGTTTYKAAYTDATLTTPAAHPVVLNARGEAQVWLGAGAYSLRLTDAAGVTVWTTDGVRAPDVAGTAQAAVDALRNDITSTALNKGASLIGLHDAATKFDATNVEAALAELSERIAKSYADRFSPWDYGASAVPGADNHAAIQACLDAAVASGRQARVVLWGDWSVSAPIVATNAKNIAIEGGVITALPGFTAGRYILEFRATEDRANDWLHVSFVKANCAKRTGVGGFLIEAGFKCTFYACQAFHFRDSYGFHVAENHGSHEVMLHSCWAMEHLYDDGAIAYTGPYGGVGFQISPNDCHLNGCVSYFTGTPLRVDSQYNTIMNCHFGFGVSVLTANASFCTITACYFDMGELRIDDPWYQKLIGNSFLHASTDANAVFLRLRPMGPGRDLRGLQVTGNTFQNNLGVVMRSIVADTSVGTFSNAGIKDNNITSNGFVNTTRRTTKQRKQLYQGPGTSWTVTADEFPFGAVQGVAGSFLSASPGVVVGHTMHVSGNNVTMTIAPAAAGSADIEMDCNVPW